MRKQHTCPSREVTGEVVKARPMRDSSLSKTHSRDDPGRSRRLAVSPRRTVLDHPPPIGGRFRHRVVATLLESTGAGSLTGFGRDRSSRNRYRESQGALRARARVE